jgi:hypothetical protein
MARLVALICLTLAACGGGASNNVIPTPSPQSGFTIAASPSSLSVAQGGASQSPQVSLNASNGFASSVSATLTSPPSGVTAAPAAITLTPAMPATFTFSASSFAQISQQPLIVNAVGGTFTANARDTATGSLRARLMAPEELQRLVYREGRSSAGPCDRRRRPNSICRLYFRVDRVHSIATLGPTASHAVATTCACQWPICRSRNDHYPDGCQAQQVSEKSHSMKGSFEDLI